MALQDLILPGDILDGGVLKALKVTTEQPIIVCLR